MSDVPSVEQAKEPKKDGEPKKKKGPAKAPDPSKRAFLALAITGGVGLVMVIGYAFRLNGASAIASAAASGVLVSGAALLGGGLLGFLFGIPRTQSEAAPRPDGATDDASARNGQEHTGYRPNTNLEQISDWLTKILVGVGLTQLSAIPEKVKQLSAYLARSLGDGDSAATFTAVILGFFGVCGFLLVYLWTRLHMAGALSYADSLAGQYQVLAQSVGKLEGQSDRDAHTLSLVERVLEDASAAKAVAAADLEEAMRGASKTARVVAYGRAEDLRTKSWRDDKPRMERTIPIFQALVAADPDHRDHRARAKLAYALKDKERPEHERADRLLSEAIQIRDQNKEPATGWYEFNRAVCRIRVLADEPVAEAKAKILPDLRVAYKYGNARLREILTTPKGMCDELDAWMTASGTTADEIARAG